MALTDRYKGEGRFIDIPYTINTGVTMTAGTPVLIDVSGTNIVHLITAIAEGTGFAGILTETLTGPHTGVTLAIEGVYKICMDASTTQGFTGCIGRAGGRAYVISATQCRPSGNTANTLTGINPMGIVTFMPTGSPNVSGAANTGTWVKIFPFQQLEALR